MHGAVWLDARVGEERVFGPVEERVFGPVDERVFGPVDERLVYPWMSG